MASDFIIPHKSFEEQDLPKGQYFKVFYEEGHWIAEGYPADIVAHGKTLHELGRRLGNVIQVEIYLAKEHKDSIPTRADKP